MGTGVWTDGPSIHNLAVFAGCGMGFAIVYAGAAALLGVEEIHTVKNKIRQRLG